MRKGFLIYEEMLKYFPIYEEAGSHKWLGNCSTLNFLTYEENLIFFIISAATAKRCDLLHYPSSMHFTIIRSTISTTDNVNIQNFLVLILCLPLNHCAKRDLFYFATRIFVSFLLAKIFNPTCHRQVHTFFNKLPQIMPRGQKWYLAQKG